MAVRGSHRPGAHEPGRPRPVGEFGAACDYTPLARLPEAQQMFAEFEAVPL